MSAAAARKIAPSRVLIPLAYAATLGGNLSIIGSPGNLVAKETIERFSEGAMSVSFFEYAKAGLPLLVLCRVLSQKEAFASFDMQAVFLLSFMTPLGRALVKTGAADLIAQKVVALTGGSGPLVLMAVLWLVTWALTQVMSNTAACALFCPIAWSVATALDADPRAVVISVLIASSIGVCTPLAIPANMLILEPANLWFKDFFASASTR